MKKIISFIALLSLSSVVFSFEWPVENISVKSIISFFGQLRGNTMSTSLVIEKPELKEDEEEAVQEVRSCETGRVLTYLYAFDDDNDFFPSTLGNAVIIEHEDNIISVYGNLAQTEISNSKTINPEVLSGAKIAQTGSSGWQ